MKQDHEMHYPSNNGELRVEAMRLAIKLIKETADIYRKDEFRGLTINGSKIKDLAKSIYSFLTTNQSTPLSLED